MWSLCHLVFYLMAISVHWRPLRHFVPLSRRPPLGAPLRGAGTALAVTEGTPELRHEQRGKENSAL